MTQLLKTLRWPLMIEIANSIFIQFLGKSTVLLILSWVVTVSVIFWGGWLVSKEKWGTLSRAACAGPIIVILGLMLIGGIYNLVTGDFTQVSKSIKTDINPRLLYLSGVVASTFMFSPIFALISFFGGILGRKYLNKSTIKSI